MPHENHILSHGDQNFAQPVWYFDTIPCIYLRGKDVTIQSISFNKNIFHRLLTCIRKPLFPDTLPIFFS